MSFDPSNSPIRVDATLEEKLKGATHEQIKELLKDAAVSQNLAVREWDESILTPTALADAPRPQKFARAVTIDNRKHIIEAATEIDLERAVSDLYRAQMQPATTTTTRQTEQPHADQTRIVNQADADRKAALDLQFQLGQIDVDTYLSKSGAIDSYLADKGIDVESLREVSASKQGERMATSWADATEEFKNSPAGADWPGGEANRAKLGEILVEMDATDHPNAENLALAYQYMKDNNLLSVNESVEQERRIANANSPSELNEALGYNERVRSSSIFGR